MSNLEVNKITKTINVKSDEPSLGPRAHLETNKSTHNTKLDWSDSYTDVHHDPDNEGGFIIEHSVDITGALDSAKRARELAEQNYKKTDEMRPLTEIPAILIEQYCNSRGVSWEEFWSASENQKHIKAILTDDSLSYFRLLSYNKNCFK